MPSSASSSSTKTPRWIKIAIIAARVILGAVFIISGWAKAVDPWGFVIKTGEYLHVWGLHFPHELVLSACIALAALEFCTGIALALGCLRRVAVWTASAFMLFMLPLTAYIAIANPVSDCGCFGDLWVISNTATFLKNIIISAICVFLIAKNTKVPPFIRPAIQWIPLLGASFYIIYIALVGYNVQPLVDFRPFPVGCNIFHGRTPAAAEEQYIYLRDGVERAFTLDSLPDDSWTFVRTAGVGPQENASIAVRDDDGFDAADEIADTDTSAVALWLVVNQPGIQSLTHAHLVSSLAARAREASVDIYALVGGSGASFERWKDLMAPSFEVYRCEDTALQQLARGTSALVLTRGADIVWKRSLDSIDPDITESEGCIAALEDLPPVERPRNILIPTALLLVLLILLLLAQNLTIFVPAKSKSSKHIDYMRKNIVAGNWKMNTTVPEGVALAKEVNEALKATKANCDVVICVPFTHLVPVAQAIDTKVLGLGAENCADHKSGAYTGEVSAPMVASTGAQYVILGHSERRQYYHETSETLREKVALALENGLTPIFCIGEVLAEREDGSYNEVVARQIEEGLFNLSAEDFGKIILAYEPVWAIGTGKTATADQAEDMHAHIRKVIATKYGEEVAQNTSILYGGSCKPSNARELFAKPDVDGGLIGGASLKCADFMGIVEAFS